MNKAAFYPTVADRENNIRYLLDIEELQQLTEEAMQQGFFEPQNLSANYTMNGTETIVSSGIILDVGGFQALEEEGEVSAANITATTNATDSNATAVTTTPIPPAETGQENATTTTTVTTEEEEEEQTTAIPAPLLE